MARPAVLLENTFSQVDLLVEPEFACSIDTVQGNNLLASEQGKASGNNAYLLNSDSIS